MAGRPGVIPLKRDPNAKRGKPPPRLVDPIRGPGGTPTKAGAKAVPRADAPFNYQEATSGYEVPNAQYGPGATVTAGPSAVERRAAQRRRQKRRQSRIAERVEERLDALARLQDTTAGLNAALQERTVGREVQRAARLTKQETKKARDKDVGEELEEAARQERKRLGLKTVGPIISKAAKKHGPKKAPLFGKDRVVGPKRGESQPVPKHFQTDAATMGTAKVVLPRLRGGKGKLKTFHDKTDRKGRIISATEQASSALARRKKAKQEYESTRNKVQLKLAEDPKLFAAWVAQANERAAKGLKVKPIAAMIAKQADVQGVRAAKQGERGQRLLDEEAIARYGTYAGSTRQKGAERAAARKEEEKRGRMSLTDRVKADANDLVKGLPASVVQSVKGYVDLATGSPGYLKDRAAGMSHAKAAKKNAPEMVKASVDFRTQTAMGRLIRGDFEGAQRQMGARPLSSALEGAAAVSGAGRLFNVARRGGTAKARARPDFKIQTAKRSKPRNRGEAKSRHKAETKAARDRVTQQQRHDKAVEHNKRVEERKRKAEKRKNGNLGVAGEVKQAKPVPRAPQAPSRAVGDKSRRYARSPVVRAAQKGRERVQIARGRDPSLMSAKKSDRRAKKVEQRGIQSSRAGSLKREVELMSRTNKAMRGVRGYRARAAAYLATGITNEGSIKKDLEARLGEVRRESGVGSREAKDIERLLKSPEYGHDARVRRAAAHVVAVEKGHEPSMERLGIVEPGAMEGRAGRIGPAARGEAVFVHEGDILPGEADKPPRPKKGGPGRGVPVRRRPAEKRKPPEPVKAPEPVKPDKLETELAEVTAKLASFGTSRKEGGRSSIEKRDPKVEQALRAYHAAKAQKGSNHPDTQKARAAVANAAGGKKLKDARRILATLEKERGPDHELTKAARDRVTQLSDARGLLTGRPMKSHSQRAEELEEMGPLVARQKELEALIRTRAGPKHQTQFRPDKDEAYVRRTTGAYGMDYDPRAPAHGRGVIHEDGSVRTFYEAGQSHEDVHREAQDQMKMEVEFDFLIDPDGTVHGKHLSDADYRKILAADPNLKAPKGKEHLRSEVSGPTPRSRASKTSVTVKGKEHTSVTVERRDYLIQQASQDLNELRKKQKAGVTAQVVDGRKTSIDILITRAEKRLERATAAKRAGKSVDEPAAVQAVKPVKESEAAPGKQVRVAERSRWIGETQATENIVGLRFAKPGSVGDVERGLGHELRGEGWTGEDVRVPDETRDAIRQTLLENEKAIGHARVFQEVAKHGSGVLPTKDAEAYVRTMAGHGRKFSVVRGMSPTLAMRLAQREGSLTPDDIDAMLKNEGGTDDGLAMALPDSVLKEWKKTMKTPGALQASGRVITRAFLRASLPLSVLWHAGNMTDLAIRAAVMGAGPMSHQDFKKFEGALRAMNPERADDILALMQGHFGSRQGVVPQPRVRDITARQRNGLERALNELTVKVGDSKASKVAVAPINKLVDEAFNLGAGMERRMIDTIMGKALVDQSRALGHKQLDHVNLARRMLTDDSLVEDFQNATLEIVGDYTKNAAARAFAPLDPFWSWFKASMKFVLYTLPVKHPIKAGLMAAAVQMTERERRRLGLSYLISAKQAKKLFLPEPQEGFLAGAIPVAGGFVPMMPLTSFGEIAQMLPTTSQSGREMLQNPVERLAGRLLPFVQDPGAILLKRKSSLGRLAGVAATGGDLDSFGRIQFDPKAAILDTLGDSFVPLHKQVGQTIDSKNRNTPGLFGNPAVNPFAPRKPWVWPKPPGRGIGQELLKEKKGGGFELVDKKGKHAVFTGKNTPSRNEREVFQAEKSGGPAAGAAVQSMAPYAGTPHSSGGGTGGYTSTSTPSPVIGNGTPVGGGGGGKIVPVPGFAGEQAATKALPAIKYITKEFNLTLSDAYGPGHVSAGHTKYGTNGDFYGSDADMDRAVKQLVKRGFRVLYDGRFGSVAASGHGNSKSAPGNAHLHVELLTGRLPGQALPKNFGRNASATTAQVTARGASGTGGWADKRYKEHGIGQAGAQLSQLQIRQLAEEEGMSPVKALEFYEITQGESNGRPGIIGHDPNGYSHGRGLAQITPEVQGAAYRAFMKKHGWTDDDLYIPRVNVKVAIWMNGLNGDWKPWYGTRYLKRGRAPGSVKSVLGRGTGSQATGGRDSKGIEVDGQMVNLPAGSMMPERFALARALMSGKVDLLTFASEMSSLRDIPLTGPAPGKRDPGGNAGPGNVEPQLRQLIEEANGMNKKRQPYLWGGGHGATPSMSGPWDCSGAISALLGVTPRVSGQFMSFGKPGPGKHFTIYASGSHVFVKIGKRFFGTSRSNPGGGAGWIKPSEVGSLSGYAQRHVAGL